MVCTAASNSFCMPRRAAPALQSRMNLLPTELETSLSLRNASLDCMEVRTLAEGWFAAHTRLLACMHLSQPTEWKGRWRASGLLGPSTGGGGGACAWAQLAMLRPRMCFMQLHHASAANATHACSLTRVSF